MAFPQILAIATGSSATAATTHNLRYPSGTLEGELLILLAAASASTPATPNAAVGWFGDSTSIGSSRIRYAYRYANGSELTGSTSQAGSSQGTGGEYAFTTTTTVSEKISYVVLRCSTGSIVNFHRRASTAGTTSSPSVAFRGGSEVKDYLVLNVLGIATSSFPTAPSTGYTFAASQSGATDSSTVWIQSKQLTSTANTNDVPSTQTLNQTSDICSVVLSLTSVSQSSYLYRALPDNDNTTVFQMSASVGGGKYVGQTFPGDGSSISRIGFVIRKSATGSPTGIMTCSLYLMTGSYAVPVNGTPTGSRLVSSSTVVNLANTDANNCQYEEFVFDPPYRTTSEQYYVAMLEAPSAAGGTVYVLGGSAANNTWTGNSVTSSDGITWGTGNDITMFVQTLTNDNQYYFNSDFQSASVENNNFEGWFSLGPQLFPYQLGIKGVGISSASSFDYVSQSIVYDSTAGKDVYAGWTIKDDPATTTTAERAQITVDFWDNPNQFTEFKARTRMKLHADWNYLWQNFTGSISTGSTNRSAWDGWIDMSETWLQDATRRGLVASSNGAGSARWSLDIAKASASLASPANLFWKLRGELQAPNADQDKTLWPPDLTQDSNGSRFNRTVSVPIDEWFWLEWYFKKGSGSVAPNAGRVTIKIETAGGGVQTLFDEINTTQYVSASTYLPQIMQGSFHPVKAYASSSILNFMSSSNKKFEIRVSDFQFFNLDYSSGVVGSFSPSFGGRNVLYTYRRISS